MLPLFPYKGALRPLLMLICMGLALFALYRTRPKAYYAKLLLLACVGYAFFLLYATFLSRTVAQTHAYRLELMGSARKAFSIDGGLWALVCGDFSAIRLDDPQSLEGIAINFLLLLPLGFLLPAVVALRGRRMRAWQAIAIASLLSALIEIAQLATRLGMLDVDDWLFNTMGAALGYWLYRRAQRCCSGEQKP